MCSVWGVVWAQDVGSNAKYKYAGEHPCSTATVKDEQVKNALVQALNLLIVRHRYESHLPQVLGDMFDTSRLEEQAAACQVKIVELTEQIEALIEQNQRHARRHHHNPE